MSDLVTSTLADGVATLTLSRPDAGNAMSWELIDAFSAAVEASVRLEGVRAFLITAQGRHFSVGGDIRAFASEADPARFIGRLARRLHEGLALLAEHPAPVVIAAQGMSAGAGLSLVASGDIVLASEDAGFAMAYAGIGLTADGGATWHLPRLIGLRATQEMAYLGRKLTAQEALNLGLVTRLVARDQLVQEAETAARTIAAGPTCAFGGIKRLLLGGSANPLQTQLDLEAQAIALAMGTEDARAAVASFLNRTQPVFEGR
ncbi:enoyl-CoA hydratase [Rhizobium sp. CRIBSB]|nr:enoyl-CoA hydratase [Rhizobium sp. CRIBSB]